MNAKDILEEYAEETGWDAASKIELLCQYIDNQQNNSALRDFLKGQAEEESRDG